MEDIAGKQAGLERFVIVVKPYDKSLIFGYITGITAQNVRVRHTARYYRRETNDLSTTLRTSEQFLMIEENQVPEETAQLLKRGYHES